MVRVGVLGAGGMGTAFAAHLARAGTDVLLIGRGSPHTQALADGPLRVEPPAGEPWAVRVPVAQRAADVAPGSIDVLLLLTKGYDLDAAVRSAAPALAAGGVAVPLQNGLGTDAQVAGAVGDERTLVGTTTVGAALQDPGRISISASTAAGESLTSIGRMGRAQATTDHDVASVLAAAGLPAEVRADVAELIWGKLALAAMSPLSSVPRVTVGAVWASPEGRSLVERMFDEVVAVAGAEGVALDREAAWAHAQRTFAGTGEHYTSMCKDVQLGRPTELASMGGAVRRLGERHGVPVPVHAAICDLLALAGVR